MDVGYLLFLQEQILLFPQEQIKGIIIILVGVPPDHDDFYPFLQKQQ
jgi:hypothetical protein